MNFADILKLLPSICAYVRQQGSAGNEHSEYVLIASVRERIMSKTSLHASKSAEIWWLA